MFNLELTDFDNYVVGNELRILIGLVLVWSNLEILVTQFRVEGLNQQACGRNVCANWS